jgi:two-component system chemotaxis sensor kinase CheA
MSDGRGDNFLDSFIEDYFAESEDHLTAVRRGLLALESTIGLSEPPAAAVEELFRSFHSLKGISAMVELHEAERLAHEMESCLGSIRDHAAPLTAGGFEALLDGLNALEQVIGARRNRTRIPQVDDRIALLAKAWDLSGRETGRGATVAARPGTVPPVAAPATGSVWKVTFTPSPDLVARGIKVDTIRARLASAGAIQSVAPRVTGAGGIAFDFRVIADDDRVFLDMRDDGVTHALVSTPALAPDSSAPVTPWAAEAAPALTSFVRVDLSRLDELMRLVGDLVVSRARLEDTLLRVERFVPPAEARILQEQTESIERQLRDLREGVMRVRLVPVAEIFRRMPFVVRDLARDKGARVQVEFAGQATEIDKFLVERMMDPLLHLVRNAVSHGIEVPEERVASGKRPDGRIRLAASTVGESVTLEVSDDGRGMDVEDIERRARAAGVDLPEGGLDARALLDVICSPGFSTRDEADRGSGRGVGMAVVRDAVQELGGTMSVETAPGLGTAFRIVLPLTLTITDALIVQVGDRTFAIPQAAVHEVAEVHVATLNVIENNELMTHRGAALPVVRLARLFSIEEAGRERMHMVVVGTGAAAMGVLVDRISSQREIVVKTLRDPLVKVAGVSGATELGDGRLVLILDVAGLIRHLRGRMQVRAAV